MPDAPRATLITFVVPPVLLDAVRLLLPDHDQALNAYLVRHLWAYLRTQDPQAPPPRPPPPNRGL